MIEGRVTDDLGATVSLNLYSWKLELAAIEAVIDTGFNDYLTLPPSTIRKLGLELPWVMTTILADNTSVNLPAGAVRIRWHDHEMAITVLEADGTPLVGMALLSGSDLRIEVVPGGIVSIDQRSEFA